MKKIIEHLDGFRWHDGDTSSIPFAKDSDLWNELIEEGCGVEYLPQAEKDAQAKLDTHIQVTQSMVSITNGIPQIEIDSWPRQEKEAREYLADNTASVPFITKLALARGIEISVLVNKIIKKADAYETALAETMGAKHKLEDEMGK